MIVQDGPKTSGKSSRTGLATLLSRLCRSIRGAGTEVLDTRKSGPELALGSQTGKDAAQDEEVLERTDFFASLLRHWPPEK
jgi:hypothetical protein